MQLHRWHRIAVVRLVRPLCRLCLQDLTSLSIFPFTLFLLVNLSSSPCSIVYYIIRPLDRVKMAPTMPMFMNVDVLRALDNFGKRSLHIRAQPFVYAADKNKRLELLNQSTELERKRREEWLAASAAEAEVTKAERLKIQEQLKLIKAEKEKEKLEKKQAAKAQKALEKEKAKVEKEEKRVRAIEEAMLKREQQKDKAIEQARKKAEERALQELKREEQVCLTQAKV